MSPDRPCAARMCGQKGGQGVRSTCLRRASKDLRDKADARQRHRLAVRQRTFGVAAQTVAPSSPSKARPMRSSKVADERQES
jgi:hypothetical protein